MNDEILDRLLIDHALGQLPADVEALLAAHLASSPEARAMAEGIEATVHLAAKALPRLRIAAPVPSPLPRLIRKDQIQRALALAASFVLGAGIALLGLTRITSRSDSAPASPLVAQKSNELPTEWPSAEVERAARSLPFWSNQRATLLTTAARRQTANRENP